MLDPTLLCTHLKRWTLRSMAWTAQAIATGVLAGLGIFVATNWLVLKGGPVVGPNLALLAQFCPGYSVTFGGSLIGSAYGFVYGGAAAVGWIYNRFVQARR